jgi:hypothetical protein
LQFATKLDLFFKWVFSERAVANVNAATLRPIMTANVDKKARLMTEDAKVYDKLGVSKL